MQNYHSFKTQHGTNKANRKNAILVTHKAGRTIY